MNERYTDIRKFLPEEPDDETVDSTSASEDVDTGRRAFMRKAVGAAVLTTPVGQVLLKGEEQLDSDEVVAGELVHESPTESQKTIAALEERVTGDTLTEQLEAQKHVTLNEHTIEAITQKWEQLYGPDGKWHDELQEALVRMAAWKERIDAIFEEEGVPVEFGLLAIPESHFQTNAYSNKGAAGPYQFIPSTARKAPARLRIEQGLDERLDPLASARACARLLKDNYKEFNNDWDLALSAYNGAYAWRYAKKRPTEERGYADFLAYMEHKINASLERYRKEHQEIVSVKRGETLSGISARTGVSVDELMEMNSITDPRLLQAGTSLALPTKHSTLMRRIFGDYIQNINYPAKYRAIVQVLNSNKDVQPENTPLRFDTYQVRKTKRIHMEHTVVRGDTLWSIAMRHKINPRILAKVNGITKSDIIQPGMELTVPLKEKPNESLRDIAQAVGASLEALTKLNPAVRNTEAPLPDSYMVRVPAGKTKVARK
jgi:membrane-bound lytic murein transglycosylase D